MWRLEESVGSLSARITKNDALQEQCVFLARSHLLALRLFLMCDYTIVNTLLWVECSLNESPKVHVQETRYPVGQVKVAEPLRDEV